MGQTWNGDLVHDAGNVLSDIGGFFSGPPGDPGRIRQVAAQVESLRGRFDADRRALDEAVNELTTSWRGDGATQFAATWSGGGGGPAPARVLHDASEQLRTFSTQLYDYADQLEHAQHEHWIELGIMAALTVVNVAQLGADPATEAAEIGEGTAMAVGTSFALTDVGTLALQGAFVGLGSDVIAQLGADVWDRMDTRFDLTGDHAVALLDPREAALSAAGGAASFAAAGTVGRVAEQFGGEQLGGLMRRPAGRLAAAGTFSAVGDAAGQLLTTGHVDWQEVATSAGINALAGTAVHGLRSGSATAPALARLMGEPRYQQFLADVQNIKAENPSLAAIPDDNLVAIRGYTSFDTSPADYTKINAALRSADPTAIAPLQPYVDNISHGLAQLPDHTGMVFRGTNLPAGVVAQYERALQSGQPLTQPAFLSTSADPAVTTQAPFAGNTTMYVNSLHGKDISAISTLPDESEVLFAAQTPFHVQDMQSLDGHLHILLQELP